MIATDAVNGTAILSNSSHFKERKDLVYLEQSVSDHGLGIFTSISQT